MKIRAAVLEEFAKPLVVREVELAAPWAATWTEFQSDCTSEPADW